MLICEYTKYITLVRNEFWDFNFVTQTLVRNVVSDFEIHKPNFDINFMSLKSVSIGYKCVYVFLNPKTLV